MKTKKYGKDHHMWKKLPSYASLHMWLRKHYQKVGVCEKCNIEAVTEWALKTNTQYKRDRNVFLELCRSCHRKQDWGSKAKKTLEDKLESEWNRTK